MTLDFKDQDAVRQERIRQQLIDALCQKNGWEHGEDMAIAIEQVDWFLVTYNQILELIDT